MRTITLSSFVGDAASPSLPPPRQQNKLKSTATVPDGFTVADFRDAVGSSRKHTLPLLGRLDETGVTRRRGDVRIAGPRLPKS